MRVWIFVLLMLSITACSGQWVESFDGSGSVDGSIWSGDTSEWQIEGGFLRSNGTPVSGTCLMLSRSAALRDSFELQIGLNLKLATSTNNYLDLFLGDGGFGWKIQIGGRYDNVTMYRVLNGVETEIFTGPDKMIQSSSSNPLILKMLQTDDSCRIWYNLKGDSSIFFPLGSVASSKIKLDSFALRACYSSSNAHSFWIDFIRLSYPVHDLIPPRVKRISSIDTTAFEIIFSEGMDTNYGKLKVAGIPALSIQWSESNQLIYPEYRNNALVFSLQGFRDVAGNILADTNIFVAPILREPHLLQITEFMRDPTPGQSLPEVEWLEIGNFSHYPIDMSDLCLSDPGGIYPCGFGTLDSGHYLILTAKGNCSLLEQYGDCSEAGIPSSFLNNGGDDISLLNRLGDTLDVIHYSSNWSLSEGGFSMEKMELFSLCPKPEQNFLPTLEKKGGTPGRQNSRFGGWSDSLPPELLSCFCVDGKRFHLFFSEELFGQASMSFLGKAYPLLSKGLYYQVNLDTTIIKDAQREYLIKLYGVRDCSGNHGVDSNITFRYADGRVPEFGSLMISEVFWETLAGQKPFIELYNRSSEALLLTGMQLRIDQNTYPLGGGILYPGQLALLLEPGDMDLFHANLKLELGKKMIFSDRGVIELFHPTTGRIDRLNYRHQKYGKYWLEQDGFSMERKDSNLLCSSVESWAPSSKTGGSPGLFAKKVFLKPREELKMHEAWMDNQYRLVLCFDAAISNEGIFIEQNEAGTGKILLEQLSDQTARSIASLQIPEFQRFRIIEGKGCNGEELSTSWQRVSGFGSERKLVINELMFDPVANRSEFVELFNNSDSAVNLKGVYLGNCKENGLPGSFALLSDTIFYMGPHAYLVLSTPTHQLDRYYPVEERQIVGLDAFPGYRNSGACVLLCDSALNMIDSFFYSPSMHASAVLDTRGVSLERIDPNYRGPQSANWTSSSQEFNYASPGRKNSENREGWSNKKEHWSLASESFSPDGDGFEDFAILSYSGLQAGTLVDIAVYTVSGSLMYSWESNSLAGVEGRYKWDGRNAYGILVPDGPVLILISYTEPGKATKHQRFILVKASFNP
ncbi:MAG: hypothetical protein GC180_00610 [Bacteroidetes bacterium]|nr:hypothetical protein [Bacteroidota bacterium]